MNLLTTSAALALCFMTVAQDVAPAPDAPAAAPDAPASAPANAPAPAAEPAPSVPAEPFSLGRSVKRATGLSPYAVDTQLNRPPKVYVLPMEGFMGLDIHKAAYERILKDLEEAKPDLVVVRLKSTTHGENETFMEGVSNQLDDDKVEPRNLAAGVTDYRDFAQDLRNRLATFPTVMYVQDARGVACVYALIFPYMFMAPGGKVAGLSVVTELAGGNDEDILAKMRSAWCGIATGILSLGEHDPALMEALVRPDRVLSADIAGRRTMWRGDTKGRWIVVDNSMEAAAGFSSQAAEDTGLSEGTAENVEDLLGLLGYPEYSVVGNGEKLYADSVRSWRAKWADVKKALQDFQKPMDDATKELPGRKVLVQKVLQAVKQSPQVAQMALWKYGLDQTRLEILLKEIEEQIRQNQKSRTGGGRKGSGGGGGGPAGPMGR